MTWYVPLIFAFGGLCMGLFGVGLVSMGAGTLRAAGHMADTPTSSVRSVAMGFAELKGSPDRSTPDQLTAPFSGRPCVYYEVSIDRYERSGSSEHRSSSWNRKWTHRDSVRFSLDDGTGSIPLNVKRATVSLAVDLRWHARGLSMTDLEVFKSGSRAVDGPGITPIGDAGSKNRNGDYRLSERIVGFDDEIYVLGTVKRGSQGPYVDLDRLRGPFIISDQPERTIIGNMRLMGWIILVVGLTAIVPVVFFGLIFLLAFLFGS